MHSHHYDHFTLVLVTGRAHQLNVFALTFLGFVQASSLSSGS